MEGQSRRDVVCQLVLHQGQLQKELPGSGTAIRQQLGPPRPGNLCPYLPLAGGHAEGPAVLKFLQLHGAVERTFIHTDGCSIAWGGRRGRRGQGGGKDPPSQDRSRGRWPGSTHRAALSCPRRILP